jgi:hypothetical protein
MKLPQHMSFSQVSPRVGFWVLLLLSLFAWAPATYPGYWEALEGFAPAFNVDQPGSLASVAMAPDLWRGSGRATFLLTRPLLLLGFDAVTAVRITFILAFLLGGLGIYAWLRTHLGDRAAAFAGLLYLLAPPWLATVYVRGSLSDALIIGLLPIALAGLTTYAETKVISAAGITLVAIGWMWQTQAGLALCCSLLLLLYALVVERNGMAALVVLVSSGAALVTLVPLLPMTVPTSVNFAEHFVAFFQFFRPSWQVGPSVPGWQDGYPFQLGPALILCSLAALWLWWVQRPTQLPPLLSRLFAFGWFVTLACIFLATVSSVSFWQVTHADRLLTYPWQILLPALPFLTLIAALLPVVQPQLQQTPYWPVLLLLTVLSSYPYLTTTYTQVQPPAAPRAVLGDYQLIVLSAKVTEDRQQKTATLAVAWQPVAVLPTDYNLFFQALAGDEQALTVVAQLDTQPLSNERPATTWRPGEILTNTYQLDLSSVAPQLQSAPLQYHFGYYDWRTGARLSVDGGIDDKLVFYGN